MPCKLKRHAPIHFQERKGRANLRSLTHSWYLQAPLTRRATYFSCAMRALLTAACWLLLAGLATAQTGNIIVTSPTRYVRDCRNTLSIHRELEIQHALVGCSVVPSTTHYLYTFLIFFVFIGQCSLPRPAVAGVATIVPSCRGTAVFSNRCAYLMLPCVRLLHR